MFALSNASNRRFETVVVNGVTLQREIDQIDEIAAMEGDSMRRKLNSHPGQKNYNVRLDGRQLINKLAKAA